eukprot:6048799-Prymnesium_polylepis.1
MRLAQPWLDVPHLRRRLRPVREQYTDRVVTLARKVERAFPLVVLLAPHDRRALLQLEHGARVAAVTRDELARRQPR